MVAACLISTTMKRDIQDSEWLQDETAESYDPIDGPSEDEAYLQGEYLLVYLRCCDAHRVGEYKTILQLVGVLSHGKVAKRLADRAIDLMQDVQNLRKAIYEYACCPICFLGAILIVGCSYKLKVDACEKGTAKEIKLRNLAVNYLYVFFSLSHVGSLMNVSILFRFRYGTLIVFANYLIDKTDETFSQWLTEHREIMNILRRRSLD